MTLANILVVEDEAIVAKDIQNRLDKLGYSVPAVAFSGEEAIEKTAEIHPDLVIMDIRLSGDIDGIDAAEQIHNRFNIPIIYLTAYADQETLDRAKITEPYGYIIKPFGERELKSNIEIALYKHKMEKTLKENKEKYQLLVDNANDGIVVLQDGMLKFINNQAKEFTGRSEKELLNKNFLEFIHTDDHELVTNNHLRRLKGEQIKPYPIRIQNKKGKYRWAEVKDVKIDWNNKPATLNFISDITKRKKYEEEIIHTKEYLEDIIQSASELIITFDTKGIIKSWNKAAETITGYKKREIVGKPITKLPVFRNSNEILNSIKNINTGSKPKFNELILKTKNNTLKTIQTSNSIINNFEKEKKEILTIGKDITQEKETLDKLVKGNSYYISDRDNKSALNLFISLNECNYKGLYITRTNLEKLRNISPKISQILVLNQDKLGKFENITDLDELTNNIEKFTKKHEDSTILLDRTDYLITRFSFEKFVNHLYQINSIITKNNSILLVYFNPSFLDPRQIAVIMEELQPLPQHKIKELQIEDELFDILKFVYEQNQINSIVTFNKISREFSIVKTTTSKRLRVLEEKDLILIEKHGRTKRIQISEKGKQLLYKRQVI